MNRHVMIAVAFAALGSRAASGQRPDTLRLSIESAVDIALRTSDEARISAAQVAVADAQVGVARASGLPQLRLSSSYSHAWESARANAVGQVFNQPNTYNTNLNLSQTLFQGGRIVAGTRAASAVREASRLDEREARAKLTVDVQRAYLQVLFTRDIVGIQDSNLALARAREQQLEQLEAAGRAARYDVLVARVSRANIEPLVIQARNDRDLAIVDLKRLLNVPLDEPMVLTSRIDAIGLRDLASTLADSSVQPDRPAIRSAELAVDARRNAITVARADRLPTATISFQSGYQAFPPLGFGLPTSRGALGETYCPTGSATGRACQNGGWFTDRSMNAVISLPLFDGLRAKSNIGLARAQEQLAELQLRQQREAVAVDVARSRAELGRARAAFDARQENAGEAREAFELASLRFSRGLSTQIEVADAQLALLTAQSNAARATYDLYLASAEMARSLGRPIPFPPTASSPRGSENGASSEH